MWHVALRTYPDYHWVRFPSLERAQKPAPAIPVRWFLSLLAGKMKTRKPQLLRERLNLRQPPPRQPAQRLRDSRLRGLQPVQNRPQLWRGAVRHQQPQRGVRRRLEAKVRQPGDPRQRHGQRAHEPLEGGSLIGVL